MNYFNNKKIVILTLVLTIVYGTFVSASGEDISVFERILDQFTSAGNNPIKDGPAEITYVLWTAVLTKNFTWAGEDWGTYFNKNRKEPEL